MPPSSHNPVPVLLLARELGSGGTERQLCEIAKALDRRQFEVHAGYFREGFRTAELRAAGIGLAPLRVTSFGKPGLVSGILDFKRYIRQHHIQLVHTFDYPLTIFAVPLARLFRVPVVLSSQRAYRELIPSRLRAFIRLTDRLVNGIVVNCKALQTHLTEEGIAPEKIRLCYNGIDINKFHLEESTDLMDHSTDEKNLVIGCVCLLRPEKDLSTLVKAFARVLTDRPGLRLLLVGSGPEREKLADLSKELGIDSLVTFQPTVQDVGAVLRSIDIFVLPSRSEALSNSLMEAMACGCAAIASRVGGNSELITPGETGLLFEQGNVNDLTVQLATLADNAALRMTLGQAAARKIKDEFSVATAAARMAAIYAQFLDSSRVR